MTDAAYVAATGTPVRAVSAEEMRAVDRVAVEAFGLPLLSMMENAGRTLAQQVRTAGEPPVTVLAGSGGNGGGGLAAGRHLANRGVDVTVVLDRDPSALDGAAATQFGVLREMGVEFAVAGDDPSSARSLVDGAGTLVDALVGYGLAGALRGPAASLVEAANASEAPVVSLDGPSGVDATTGERPGPAVDPAQVLTLGLPKTGLMVLECALVLADLGIPAAAFERVGVDYRDPFGDRPWTRLDRAASG